MMIDTIKYLKQKNKVLNQKLADSYLDKAEADVEIVKLIERVNAIDTELDNEQCENATFRDEVVELDELREENDMLAIENKNMARHLLSSDYSPDEVDSICKGYDDWLDEDSEEETPAKTNAWLLSGGW